ncbi:hypothetical protein Tco_0807126 [Tanacetum coccineum]
MQKDDGIFISQDKYVADILKKFDFVTVKTASNPIETNKALLMDEEAEDVDVHLYRSMIGSLMYLTASRPGIMFAVCSCARFQVTLKVSHLHAVKRIFRYLKASLDRKSTTRGCQFLGKRLISWQCKKQTIVANSTTKVKYVAAANCCGQMLWIQNQMLDYGFNFMNTKIHIDNKSTICIVKNPVFHSKTKHIEIRHHFIRDSYEKKLIQVIKIHTDHNVANLLTKAFNVSRDGISDEFGVKTGSCKVNAARQDLVLLGEISTVELKLVLFVTVGDNTAEGVNSKNNGFFATDLQFVDQHNMVACLERSNENAEFHQIVDFLTTSSIHYALTSSGPPKKVGDEAVYTGEDDRVVRAATTASSLEAEQESGSGPRRQDTTLGSADAQTRFETASKKSHDPPLSEGNTSGSGEDSMEHPVDLTYFVPPTPHDSSLSGGHILGSDKDCSRLGDPKAEKRSKIGTRRHKGARTPGMKLFKIGTSRRKGLDKENVSKQGRKSDKTKPMFNDSDFDVLDDAMENVEGGSTAKQITTAGDKLNTASINVSVAGPSHVSTAGPSKFYVIVGPSTSTAGDIFEDEMTTIVDTLVAIRSARPRTTSVMIRNVEEEPRRATPVPTVQSQDKGKGKMVEPEPTLKNPRKAQIQMDEEIAQRLFEEEQAQFEKEARIAWEKAVEQKSKDDALIEQIEDVQARMDVDELLAERLQQEERE